MDDNETNNMNAYESNMEHNTNVPATAIRSHAPQLSQSVPGHGTGSEGSQNIGEGGDANSAPDGTECWRCLMQESLGDDASDDGNDMFEGEEGLENHKLELPGHGLIDFRTIFTALARHESCTCHPDFISDDHPFTRSGTPGIRGIDTPSSMHVEISTGEHSIESSMFLSTRSTSSSAYIAYIAYMGNSFTGLPVISHFIGDPLSLIPELIFSREIDTTIHYPIDLSISTISDDGSHSEYDMW